MKILYHHRTAAGDAQGIHIAEMVSAFRALGHEVAEVALIGAGEGAGGGGPTRVWARVGRWIPAWLYELMGLAYNLYGYLQLRRRIAADRPDLIYERYALNAFCGVWAGRRAGVPLVLEVNAPLAEEQRALGRLAFGRLARWSERWICAHSTVTLVVSRALEEVLIREGVAPERLAVVPNGIDPRRFHPNVSGLRVRERLGLAGATVIGFVGWFRRWHGLEMLLEAAHEARLAEREVRLLLVGDGPAHGELCRLAERLGLLPAVVFAGPVGREEVPEHLAAMDIAVQPSAPAYACPMKIFEYMGTGRCIVAPDQPNIREILDDGATGFLFRPGDRESLREVLDGLLGSPETRLAAGRLARERLLERGFLWEANARRALALAAAAGTRPGADAGRALDPATDRAGAAAVRGGGRGR